MTQKLSIAALVVGALLAVAVLVGAALYLYPPANAADGARSAQQAGDLADAARFRQQALDDPAGALASCERARGTAFDALAAHLPEGSSFAASRFVADGLRGLTYLSADVLDAPGSLQAAAPVWVYGRAGYAGLSPSADRLSTRLPDAGTRYGTSPQDSAAVRVAACAEAARRLAPTGG